MVPLQKALQHRHSPAFVFKLCINPAVMVVLTPSDTLQSPSLRTMKVVNAATIATARG
jgi:hypothetical protein